MNYDDLPICPATDLRRTSCFHCLDAGFQPTPEEWIILDAYDPDRPLPAQKPAQDRRKGRTLPTTYRGYAYQAATAPPIVDGPNTCPCGKPTANFLCSHCADQYEVDLGNIPALWEDLQMAVTRQTNMGPGAGSGFTEYGIAASAAADQLTNALAAAARHLCDSHNLPHPTLDGPVHVSRWLLTHARVIPLDPAGPDIANQLRTAVAHCMRVIDRHPDKTYLGLCPHCMTPMRAWPDDIGHRCVCGHTCTVADAMEALQVKVWEALVPRARLQELAKIAGHRVTHQKIGRMIESGKLQTRLRNGQPVYLVGQLLGILENDQDRRTA